jgi:EAL domain-containing protein (putative c-di-GMP-specific phosphodiesterase class I)
MNSHNQILKELKCDYGQGYYFSAPLEVAAAEEYLQNIYRKRG